MFRKTQWYFSFSYRSWNYGRKILLEIKKKKYSSQMHFLKFYIKKNQRYITIFYNHQFFIRQLLLHCKGRTVIIQLANKIPHPENFNSCFLWLSVWLNLTFVCGQVLGYLLFWTCLPSFHNASQGTVVDIDKVNKMMFLLLNISLKLPWIFFFLGKWSTWKGIDLRSGWKEKLRMSL